MKNYLIVYRTSLIVSILCSTNTGLAQSKFAEILREAVVEVSYNPGLVETRDWRIENHRLDQLKYLKAKDDKIGLLNDEYSDERPMNVSIYHIDYSDTWNLPKLTVSTSVELIAKIMVPVSKSKRFLVGLSLNLGNSYFNTIEYNSFYSDIPLANSSYFIEPGNFDSFRIEFDYSRRDTLFVLPRAKIIDIQYPQKHYGFGINFKYVLIENIEDRSFWSTESGVGISSTLRSPTTVYYSYYDYNQTGDHKDISDIHLRRDDRIEWINPQPGLQTFNFPAPPIIDLQYYYGLNWAFRPILKFPLLVGLRVIKTHHQFRRVKQVIATTSVLSFGIFSQFEL